MISAREALIAAAKDRILLTDGGWGTQIQLRKLGEADYAGSLGLGHDQKGNNDILALTRQDVVTAIGEAYLAAGSDIVSTNTFSANRISQADYGAEALVADINHESARLGREAADKFAAEDGRRRFVADVYREQVIALAEGGADFILIETIFDTLNAKAGIAATLEAETKVGRELPLMISMTLTDLSGRNLSGHTVEAFWYAVRHAKPLTVGLNCSFGAAQLRPHVRVLSDLADTLVMVYPNAGLPNELGEYDELPDTTAALVREWADHGQVNILGGCCGSTPAHIAAMAKAVQSLPARRIPEVPVRTRLAGLEPFTMAA